MKENIFLIGFSGTGKSSTGQALAKRLGFDFVDTDLQIEANEGRSVQEIFAREGEEVFRRIESAVLDEVCKEDHQIVSTGGGIVLSKANRTQMTASGYVVCLEARPETIYVRLLLDQTQRSNGGVRPLLQGGDQFERITSLKAGREPFYAEADWTVHTDFMNPEEVAAEIERAIPLMKRRGEGKKGGLSPAARAQADAIYYVPSPAAQEKQDNTLTVKTSLGSYKVLFTPGLLGSLGELLKKHLPDSANRAVFVITDAAVGQLYGHAVISNLLEAGFRATLHTVPAGEKSKSLAQVQELYHWLAADRAERRDVIVALGGGVVGDLAGFVAATWLRGVPLVQVPTTLLSMVDSSVGGKTGVNLPQGKNLVGAFYPPRLVVADVALLGSLPERERRSGWAEVIKHAIIPGADPDEKGAQQRLSHLENSLPGLLARDPATTSAILRESVAVKAGVVEQDERESGLRMTLNYGHTYGHALEAASGYSALLHGEGIAIGMHGVALLAQRLGFCDAPFVERQKKLIQAFGFALTANVSPEKALAAMGLDKRRERGAIRWIIPRGVGRIEIRQDIPEEVVREVLLELVNPVA